MLSIGGSVQLYDPQNPRAPLEFPITRTSQLPAAPFELSRVNLDDNSRVTDADLAKFTVLKRLSQLKLNRTSITSDGLNRLGELPALRSIEIDQTRVDATGVRSLVRFPSLYTLVVPHLPLTDDDAAFLSKRMPNLRGLFAQGSKISDQGLRTLLSKPQFWAGSFSGISDAGVEPLRNRENMVVLQLYDCRVTRKGVEAIATCPNLEELFLRGIPAIDDGCVVELAKLPKLRRLSLNGASITDAGLAALHSCCTLRDLNISETKVTADGVAALHAALPECRITWDGGVVEPSP